MAPTQRDTRRIRAGRPASPTPAHASSLDQLASTGIVGSFPAASRAAHDTERGHAPTFDEPSSLPVTSEPADVIDLPLSIRVVPGAEDDGICGFLGVQPSDVPAADALDETDGPADPRPTILPPRLT